MNVYEDYITDFNEDRKPRRIYGDECAQLILKNYAIPDGITIIGTDESITRFMNAALSGDEFAVYGAGFYPWKVGI